MAYPIPEPIYYDEKTYSENTFVSVGGEYEITKKTDSGYILIQEYRTFGKGNSFTPDSAGDYVITYRALNQTSAITIRVEDDLAKTRILPNILPTSCYINDTLNLGAEYALPMYDKLSFGFLSSTRINGKYSWSEGRFSANVSPLSWFEAGINYGITSYGSTMGWIVNFHPRVMSLFVGMDYIVGKVSKQYIPLNNMNMNLSFGLNVTF